MIDSDCSVGYIDYNDPSSGRVCLDDPEKPDPISDDWGPLQWDTHGPFWVCGQEAEAMLKVSRLRSEEDVVQYVHAYRNLMPFQTSIAYELWLPKGATTPEVSVGLSLLLTDKALDGGGGQFMPLCRGVDVVSGLSLEAPNVSTGLKGRAQ